MTETARPRFSRPVLALAALAGAGLVAGGIYGIGGLGGNGPGGLCAASLPRAARLAPLVHGEVAAMVPASGPLLLSELGFTGDSGQPAALRDWRGKVVLLNLWATWCGPCKAEMPDLDRLQAMRGSGDFEVVTVNIDTGAAEKRKKFLAEAGIKTLRDHTDPGLGIYNALKAAGLSRGMPTTVLIDRDGCQLAAMNGPAQWVHKDALALIDAAIALPKPGATP